MYASNPLPLCTTSPVARHLHALLRYSPGYKEACTSPCKTAWVVNAVLQLSSCDDLPIGCQSAARELQVALPFFAPKLTRYLSIDQLCKIIVELGRYCAYRSMVEDEYACEQARNHRR
jgi:hypothetical protein